MGGLVSTKMPEVDGAPSIRVMGVKYPQICQDVISWSIDLKGPFRAEIPGDVVRDMGGTAVVTLSPLIIFCGSCSGVLNIWEAWRESSYVSNGGSLGIKAPFGSVPSQAET